MSNFYKEMLEHLDHEIGRLLAALQRAYALRDELAEKAGLE